MNDQVQQVTDYIRRAMVQGVTEPEVRDSLAASGWPQNLIDEGFLRYYSPALPPAQPLPPGPVGKPRKSRTILYSTIATVIALIIIVVVAILLITHSAANKPAFKTPSSSITATQSATNTNRKNDVSSIAAAVENYIADANGTFPEKTGTDIKTPKVIDICGANCADATHETALLNAYKNTPAAIAILPYASDLKAPALDKIYIVLGATCDNTKLKLGTAQQIAILYSLAAGSKTTPQCLAP